MKNLQANLSETERERERISMIVVAVITFLLFCNVQNQNEINLYIFNVICFQKEGQWYLISSSIFYLKIIKQL